MAKTKTITENEIPVADKTTGINNSTVQSAPKPVQLIVATDRGLNLRSGPCARFDVKCVLNKGTAMEELKLPHGVQVPGWRLVKAGIHYGWVDERFIKMLEG